MSGALNALCESDAHVLSRRLPETIIASQRMREIMAFIKRIIYFLSLFVLFIILKELTELYVLARDVHPLFGYGVLLGIVVFLVYFVGIPIYKLLKIPTFEGPVRQPEKVPELINLRFQRFAKNPALQDSGIDLETLEPNQNGYDEVVKILASRVEVIRKRYVLQLFYSSSISQNGFLDAILILSSSVNLVREIFTTYCGRVSNRDLLAIGRRVYLSMAIGGSEGIEFASQELFSKMASDSIRSVPFADRIFGSLADGFVNAALLTRISLITENYCKTLYIKSDRDFYPSAEFILRTTKMITGDIVDRMTGELVRMGTEKTADYVMMAINPVAHLFGRTVGMVKDGTTRIATHQKEMFKDIVSVAQRPFGYGFNRLIGIFQKKNN